MKKTLFFMAVFGISMVFRSTVSFGYDFCVWDGGTGEHDLQTALSTAQSNNQDNRIRIVQGTFTGNFVYSSSHGYSLTLEGGYTTGCTGRTINPSNTTLDGDQSGRVLLLFDTGGGNLTVEGCTIQNGNTIGGGGGLLAASNYYGPGGPSGDVRITHTIIRCNTASTNGGGISAGSSPDSGTGGKVIITRNFIIENTASDYDGGGVFVESISGSGTPGMILLANNIIVKNECGKRGGGIYTYSRSDIGEGGAVMITNNTVTENNGHIGGGLYMNMDDNTNSCYNNIIWGNTLYDPFDIRTLGSGTTGSYNNNYSAAYDPWDYETGRINLNPRVTANYHLQPASPCIDAGYNLAAYLPAADFDGDIRVLDGNRDGVATVDIGADEFIFKDNILQFLWLLLK